MIKITNGTLTTTVSKGAFDLFYANQGFVVVSEKETNIDVEWEENENEENQYIIQ